MNQNYGDFGQDKGREQIQEQFQNHGVRRLDEKHTDGWAVFVLTITGFLVVAAVLAVGFRAVVGGFSGQHSPTVEIEIGRVHSTQWFNFTIHSAERIGEYGGHTAAFGHTLWVVEITQTGTDFDPVPMWIWDWYMDGDDFRTHLFAHSQFVGRDEMMPDDFWLERGQSETHILLFEAPTDAVNLTLNFVEIFDGDFVGARFMLQLQ